MTNKISHFGLKIWEGKPVGEGEESKEEEEEEEEEKEVGEKPN